MLFETESFNAPSQADLNDPQEFAWLLAFQQKIFHDALPDHLQDRFRTMLAPIINNSFIGANSIGRAFTQWTAELLSEVTRNTNQLPNLAAITVPVTLIWGECAHYFGACVAEDLMPYLKNAKLHLLTADYWPQINVPSDVARPMRS